MLSLLDLNLLKIVKFVQSNGYLFYLRKIMGMLRKPIKLIATLIIEYLFQINGKYYNKISFPLYIKLSSPTCPWPFALTGAITYNVVKYFTNLKDNETVLEIGCEWVEQHYI